MRGFWVGESEVNEVVFNFDLDGLVGGMFGFGGAVGGGVVGEVIAEEPGAGGEFFEAGPFEGAGFAEKKGAPGGGGVFSATQMQVG